MPKNYSFPNGSKFILDGTVYSVRKAYFESNTDLRLLYSENGEEITMLSSLRKDCEGNPSFTIVK